MPGLMVIGADSINRPFSATLTLACNAPLSIVNFLSLNFSATPSVQVFTASDASSVAAQPSMSIVTKTATDAVGHFMAHLRWR
jgi:hypothetical protein